MLWRNPSYKERPHRKAGSFFYAILERVTGIEPALTAWEAAALPQDLPMYIIHYPILYPIALKNAWSIRSAVTCNSPSISWAYVP